MAATLKNLDILTEDNVPPSAQAAGQKNEDEVALFIGDISPLLTIWRGLYVELDSMAAGREQGVSGLISNAGIETSPNHPSHSWATVQAFGPTWQAGRFEGGVLTIVPLAPLEIVDNIGNSVYVNGDITGQINQIPNIVDDDESFEARKADISLLTEKLNQAYVTVIEVPSRSTLNIPFLSNFPDDNVVIENISKPGRGNPNEFATSPQYWTVQIVTGYQEVETNDCDPDPLYHFWPGEALRESNDPYLGVTISKYFQGYDNVSLIFREACRDWCAWTSESYSTWPTVELNYLERLVVAHEVGHVLGCEHRPTGIMGPVPANPPESDPDFTKPDIKCIRQEIFVETP